LQGFDKGHISSQVSIGGYSNSSKMLSSNKSGVGGLSVLSNNGPHAEMDLYFNNEDLSKINGSKEI
jgi:hypothetical protein